MSGGPSVDLAGTRTVKEILRAVNAKRLGVKVGRRLSESADPNTSTPAAVPGSAGSVAPAAAVAASRAGRGDRGGNIELGSSMGGRGPGLPSGRKPFATNVPLGLPKPLDKTAGKGGGEKVEAAADLLARVRGQLERSEQRTKGVPGGRGATNDRAPPR